MRLQNIFVLETLKVAALIAVVAAPLTAQEKTVSGMRYKIEIDAGADNDRMDSG